MNIKQIFADEELTQNAKLMYMYLHYICEQECYNEVYFSNSELCMALNIRNLNTLIKSREELIEHKLLKTYPVYSMKQNQNKIIIKTNKIIKTAYIVSL